MDRTLDPAKQSQFPGVRLFCHWAARSDRPRRGKPTVRPCFGPWGSICTNKANFQGRGCPVAARPAQARNLLRGPRAPGRASVQTKPISEMGELMVPTVQAGGRGRRERRMSLYKQSQFAGSTSRQRRPSRRKFAREQRLAGLCTNKANFRSESDVGTGRKESYISTERRLPGHNQSQFSWRVYPDSAVAKAPKGPVCPATGSEETGGRTTGGAPGPEESVRTSKANFQDRRFGGDGWLEGSPRENGAPEAFVQTNPICQSGAWGTGGVGFFLHSSPLRPLTVPGLVVQTNPICPPRPLEATGSQAVRKTKPILAHPVLAYF